MKVSYGYKLFEQDTEGNLYPLFIDNNTPITVGEWTKAKICYNKNFAVRPGFHLGLICDAPWLKSYDGTDVGYYKGRRKGWKRVWAECEYISDIDYNDVVCTLPKKCFTDRLPDNGYYKFKETGCNRCWIICDRIKVTRVLTQKDRQEILNSMHYNEAETFAKYKRAFEKRADHKTRLTTQN